MDSLSGLSLGSIALIIFAGIAILTLLRGLAHILWVTTVILISGFVAFRTWNAAPTLSQNLFGTTTDRLSWILTIAVFLLSAIALRYLINLLLAAPRTGLGGRKRRKPLRNLILSLIPASALCLGGGTFLRHLGSLSELKSFALNETPGTSDGRAKEDASLQESPKLLAAWKEKIDRILPAAITKLIDPGTSDDRLKFVKLLIAANSSEAPNSDDSGAPPKAIPVLENYQTRELILSDPQLRQLAREQRYSEILRHPKLDQLLENSELREVLANTQL